jgi:hypothetical protein
MGRPCTYSAEIAARICQELSEGRTLREICRADDLPGESTIRNWVADDRDGFAAHYARAREVGYQSMADELLEIADDGSNDWMERKNKDGTTSEVENHEVIGRSRLRVDTRKWLLAKALPKIYGEKVTTEVTGKDGGPVAFADLSETEAARRIAFTLAKATQPTTH